jgi:1-phosphofructokinase
MLAGQGFWFARMLAALGARVTLCGTFGGESGAIVLTLIEREGIAVRSVMSSADNGAYVHDRRDGERRVIVETRVPALPRHTVDDLYAVTLIEGLESDACLLGGSHDSEALPPETYRRLAADLTSAGKLVVADLSGDELTAVVEGGVSVVKVSHDALVADGHARGDDPHELIAAMRTLQQAGAARVVVTRADQPALALADRVVTVAPPRVHAVDPRGAGDSLTADLAMALASGADWEDALRYGAAAGALNSARRGLGTGTRDEIERLAAHVRIAPVTLGKQAAAVAKPRRTGGSEPKTRAELDKIAKRRKLPGRSRMGRDELARALSGGGADPPGAAGTSSDDENRDQTSQAGEV